MQTCPKTETLLILTIQHTKLLFSHLSYVPTFLRILNSISSDIKHRRKAKWQIQKLVLAHRSVSISPLRMFSSLPLNWKVHSKNHKWKHTFPMVFGNPPAYVFSLLTAKDPPALSSNPGFSNPHVPLLLGWKSCLTSRSPTLTQGHIHGCFAHFQGWQFPDRLSQSLSSLSGKRLCCTSFRYGFTYTVHW